MEDISRRLFRTEQPKRGTGSPELYTVTFPGVIDSTTAIAAGQNAWHPLQTRNEAP
jgi:hypothetical protein